MRKNKMMRTAAVLGVATMLTASVLSGTFAKYTTTAEGTDSARVARWGVKITMANDDSIFSSTYAKNSTDTQTNITNTVVAKTHTDSVAGDKVVAPGTSGETTFSISGTPEVAFKLDVAVSDNSAIKVEKDKDISMSAGEFADGEVKVKLTKDYEPIKFTLSKKSGNTYEKVKKNQAKNSDATDMTLEELKTELNALSNTYGANTPVNDEYKISWKWDYTTTLSNIYSSDAGYTTYSDADILDTYLGNQENAQTEKYKITITATQID